MRQGDKKPLRLRLSDSTHQLFDSSAPYFARNRKKNGTGHFLVHGVTFLAPLRTAGYTSFEIPDRERWVFGGVAIWLEMAAPVYFLSPLIKQTDRDVACTVSTNGGLKQKTLRVTLTPRVHLLSFKQTARRLGGARPLPKGPVPARTSLRETRSCCPLS